MFTFLPVPGMPDHRHMAHGKRELQGQWISSHTAARTTKTNTANKGTVLGPPLSLLLLYPASSPLPSLPCPLAVLCCCSVLYWIILLQKYPLHLYQGPVYLFLVLPVFPFCPSLVRGFGLTCPQAHLASGPPAFSPPVTTSPFCLCAPPLHTPSTLLMHRGHKGI